MSFYQIYRYPLLYPGILLKRYKRFFADVGDSADPLYGQLLREAILQGLEVLPCRFEVTPVGIRYLGLATLKV